MYRAMHAGLGKELLGREEGTPFVPRVPDPRAQGQGLSGSLTAQAVNPEPKVPPLGASIIRIGLKSMLDYNCNKQPPTP